MLPRSSARASRRIPRRSPWAVRQISTRLSGSSTQSTGTSWMRRPTRSASTSSSVSKNHAVSSTSGRSSWATSERIALKPHWASENCARRVPRSSRLYPREMISRLDPAGCVTRGRAAADRQVRVPRQQRRDQREQGVEVRGQVHVHVHQDLGPRGRPDLLEGTAPALLLQEHHPHLVVLVGEPVRHQGRAVGAGVVGDRDAEGVRQPGQVLVDPRDRPGEVHLLVVDRDHHVERGCVRVRERQAAGSRLGGGGAHRTPADRS